MAPLTEAEERSLFADGRISEFLQGKSYEEVDAIRAGFAARNKLRSLGLEDRLSEAELGDALDAYMGLADEPAATRTYGTSDEDELARKLDVYMGIEHDPSAGQPVTRAFSAADPDGDTPSERALADAFDRYMGVD